MTDERTYDAEDDRMPADRREDPSMTQRDTSPDMPDRSTRSETAYDGNDANRGTVRSEPIESQRTSRTMDQWPEMADYRRRFDEIQSDFIEDPRKAVGNAEKLVQEALDRMTSSMRERIQGMHRDADSGDTEKLRLEMRSLRDFIESLGGRRAA